MRKLGAASWEQVAQRFHGLDRFEHEVFHKGLAAEFAWLSKVRGGGLNPGSTQVRTLGLDQRGGRPNINIKNLGSTQVQPRFNPGSTQVQPRFKPGSTQV